MWQEIWTTVLSEFSDVPDIAQITRITLRLVVAAALGGLLGYEREQQGKSAGVRRICWSPLGPRSLSWFPNKLAFRLQI